MTPSLASDGVDPFFYFLYHTIMKYSVIIHKSEYGYDVRVPALPGCHSQGTTEQEALENIQDAIVTYLQLENEELKNSTIREVEVVFA